MARKSKGSGGPPVEELDRGELPGLLGGVVWGGIAYVLTWIGLIGLGAYHVSGAPDGSDDIVESHVISQVGFPIESITESGNFESEPLIEMLLWAFYSGHGVPLEIEAADETYTIDVLEAWSALPNVSSWTYLAVPAFALAFCGFLLASRAGSNEPIQGAIAGAFVAVGYGAVFVGGLLFATAESIDGALSLGPATSDAIIRGVAYPLLAGGVGGGLAGLVKT